MVFYLGSAQGSDAVVGPPIAIAGQANPQTGTFLSMSFISLIGCAVDRHRPIRRKVAWDGKHYVGHCRHCGAEIIRVAHHKWRKRDA
jgi:hypothetical protein